MPPIAEIVGAGARTGLMRSAYALLPRKLRPSLLDRIRRHVTGGGEFPNPNRFALTALELDVY